jgi:hypothetical protein
MNLNDKFQNPNVEFWYYWCPSIHEKNVMLFPIQKGGFFTRSIKTRGWAEAHIEYAAQPILQFDAEIVKKAPFWMETN